MEQKHMQIPKPEYQITIAPDKGFISIKENGRLIDQAAFAYDKIDKTALVSFNDAVTAIPATAIDQLLSELTRYVQAQSGEKSKIFTTFPLSANTIIEQAGYAMAINDRIMIMHKNTKVLPEISAPKLEGSNLIINSDKKELAKNSAQVLALAHQDAYWGEHWQQPEVHQRIDSASIAMSVNLQKQNIIQTIGFVRLVTNGQIAYISDMVIDRAYQSKGIGKYLFCSLLKEAYQLYPQVNTYTLMVADQGIGKIAAPKLYSHFGFEYSNAMNCIQNNQGIFFKSLSTEFALSLQQQRQQQLKTSELSTTTLSNIGMFKINPTNQTQIDAQQQNYNNLGI